MSGFDHIDQRNNLELRLIFDDFYRQQNVFSLFYNTLLKHSLFFIFFLNFVHSFVVCQKIVFPLRNTFSFERIFVLLFPESGNIVKS